MPQASDLQLRAANGRKYGEASLETSPGPRARETVSRLASPVLPGRFRCAELEIAGSPALVCGTGYTGEDGVELLVAPDAAVGLWDELVAAGATPAGLGARDTLRLEACYCLYGNELTEARTPIGAGLGWCCKEETGFIGAEPAPRTAPRAPRSCWCRS